MNSILPHQQMFRAIEDENGIPMEGTEVKQFYGLLRERILSLLASHDKDVVVSISGYSGAGKNVTAKNLWRALKYDDPARIFQGEMLNNLYCHSAFANLTLNLIRSTPELGPNDPFNVMWFDADFAMPEATEEVRQNLRTSQWSSLIARRQPVADLFSSLQKARSGGAVHHFADSYKDGKINDLGYRPIPPGKKVVIIGGHVMPEVLNEIGVEPDMNIFIYRHPPRMLDSLLSRDHQRKKLHGSNAQARDRVALRIEEGAQQLHHYGRNEREILAKHPDALILDKTGVSLQAPPPTDPHWVRAMEYKKQLLGARGDLREAFQAT